MCRQGYISHFQHEKVMYTLASQELILLLNQSII